MRNRLILNIVNTESIFFLKKVKTNHESLKKSENKSQNQRKQFGYKAKYTIIYQNII